MIRWLLQSALCLHAKKFLLFFAICVLSCAISGCIESSFNLASESRLPNSITLPPGLTRSDVAVELNLYTGAGYDAKFILKDRKGKKLAEIKGKTKGFNPIIFYDKAAVSRTPEILQLKPYNEYENMEQFGHPVALFYVIDGPCIRKELLSGNSNSKTHSATTSEGSPGPVKCSVP